jgi:hypothetical protein
LAQVVERRPIQEVLSDRILDGTVKAALFSTYTFSRPYFENEVLTGFLGERGLKRGRSPVTVLMDHEMFEGAGWGYDVQLFGGGRLWHPKVTALFLAEGTQTIRRRTVLLVGSGNLTSSGWESNLELFLVLEWDGWSLPRVIESWIGKNGFASDSCLGRWYSRFSAGKPPKYVEKALLSSLGDNDIWSQWDWWGTWSVAHVLAPFMDSPEDEGSNDTRSSYLQELSKLASYRARIHLYLNTAPDGRAYAHWPTLKQLIKEHDLRVHQVVGGNLHAKLQAVRVQGCWQILGGSPNPTANAMLKATKKKGNVEVAWQTTSRSLSGGLLPSCEDVDLKWWNFTLPKPTRRKKRWVALSGISYNPKTKKLLPRWIKPHGSWDTRMLLGELEVQPDEPFKLEEERAVQTLPREPNRHRSFGPDWVPIEFPPNESDDPILLKEWTLDQILSLMAGREDFQETNGLTGSSSVPSKPNNGGGEGPGFEFPWHTKVAALEESLTNTLEKIESADSSREASFWMNIVRRCLRSADPDEVGITLFESSWREWVRARLCNSLLGLDGRRAFTTEFRELAARWQRRIDPRLRDPREA